MPMEWLIILQEKTPLVTYTQLQEMSCKEVHDVLEVMQMRRMYELEEARINQAQDNKSR